MVHSWLLDLFGADSTGVCIITIHPARRPVYYVRVCHIVCTYFGVAHSTAGAPKTFCSQNLAGVSAGYRSTRTFLVIGMKSLKRGLVRRTDGQRPSPAASA